MKISASLLLICCVILVYGQQQDHDVYKGIDNPKKMSVAINEFVGKGLAEGEANTLTDAFRSYLINTGRFRVMERGQMDAILKEQGFQRSGACTDEACMVEMGQLLGVENIVAGSVGKVGATFSINVRLISVATGEIIRSVNRFHKGEIDDLLTELLPTMASDLTDQGPIAPRPLTSIVERKTEPVNAKDVVTKTADVKTVETKAEANGTKKTVKKRKTGLIFVGLGVVVAGGGVAAYFLTSKKKEPGSEGPQTGEIVITWE